MVFLCVYRKSILEKRLFRKLEGGGKYGFFFFFFFYDSLARNRLENDFSRERMGGGGREGKGNWRREMIFDGQNRIFEFTVNRKYLQYLFLTPLLAFNF